MDVARELKSVRYRVALQVRGMALEAEARIYGMEPHAYVEAVLYAQHLTTKEEIRVAGEQARSALQSAGEAYGNMVKAIQEMVTDFGTGFQRALGQ